MANHLTMEERDHLAHLKLQGADQKEIAKALSRSPATISRELRRNQTGNNYYAGQAQQKATRRRVERPLTRKMDDPKLNESVRRGLPHEWAPAQIAGRLKQEHADCPDRHVSAQTIYTWIENDEYREPWKSFLRRRGKRPYRRKKPDGIGAPIDQRPEVIEQRLRLGDWEGDTVLGPAGTGGLATLVDRKSRYTIVVKIRCKEADHVHHKIKERLRELDEQRRRSITFDNGTEFARCRRLEKHLGMTLYFADPGCPYQRGTNENTNGLIRQYFRKGTDFRDISHDEVRRVEKLLNGRPRECLGFRTPDAVFFEKNTAPNCD
ncbi:MAG: IS30 family transposase [Planctomycetota bacterium]|nr:IS30 family transposase [Planctomycetota bacterium]